MGWEGLCKLQSFSAEFDVKILLSQSSLTQVRIFEIVQAAVMTAVCLIIFFIQYIYCFTSPITESKLPLLRSLRIACMHGEKCGKWTAWGVESYFNHGRHK